MGISMPTVSGVISLEDCRADLNCSRIPEGLSLTVRRERIQSNPCKTMKLANITPK